MKDPLLAFCGTAINSVLAVIVLLSGAYPQWLGLLMLASVMVGWLGVVAASAGNRQLGGRLVIGGAVLFVPIGLLAILGGRKILNAKVKRRRGRRRRAMA